MKILYLADYFFPFVHGGAETSILEMAKALAKKSQPVFVLTPHYGGATDEKLAGITVHRYPFPVKLASTSSELTTAWHFNPLYWLTLTLAILKVVRQQKIDVIHCQSATTVISGVIVGKLLKVPTIITFRDNQILCNYGFCLTSNQFGKTCSLVDYFTKDFWHYYKNTVKHKNPFNFTMHFFFACLGRIRVKTLQSFAHMCDAKVVSSNSQKKTFATNGFKDVKVIHNIFNFPPNIKSESGKQRKLLYATKLSPGKGLNLLLQTFERVVKIVPNLKLQIVGGGDVEKYDHMAKELNIQDHVIFSGRLDKSEVNKIRSKVLLEVVPSIYPESFGRAALEALAHGLPVVASNRGGLTDIVENEKTGFVIEPTLANLTEAIVKGVKENAFLRKNIKEDYPNLKRKFETQPVSQHVKLYTSLL